MLASGHRLLRYCAAAAAAWALVAATACERAQTATPEPAAAPAAARERPVVLFLGTSLTAGHGLPSDEAFPALVQERIDAAGLDYRVVNAGVSGDTSAGALRRLDWLLRLPLAVLVLELGANDMLRGLSPAQLERNLAQILERTRAAHPAARFVVAGMRAAPNLGLPYVRDFEAVFPRLARANGALLVPFLLEGVAAVASLNQADGIHPNAEGHRRVADALWQALAPLLREAGSSAPGRAPAAGNQEGWWAPSPGSS
jgi:acyl-CoA thioesterase-1